MNVRQRVIQTMNSLLQPTDICLMRKSVIDRLQKETEIFYAPSFRHADPPPGALSTLVTSNPRLRELKARYARNTPTALQASRWSEEHVKTIQLPWFRGDNPYVWQMREKNTEGKHIATAMYMKSIDRHGWMNLLQEDGLFGAYIFEFDGGHVSRDLLDSLAELYFLEETLQISEWRDWRVLDIGAGYGRLAHRASCALPNLSHFFCVDAIPESTFLSEYYLGFREVERTTVVPLDQIDEVLKNNPIRLATNIHSFSECTLSAVGWWLDLLRDHAVPYLMIVPDCYSNGGHKMLTRETAAYDSTQMRDFFPEITRRGYRLVEKRPKYLDPNVQRYGISPTFHYLFELSY